MSELEVMLNPCPACNCTSLQLFDNAVICQNCYRAEKVEPYKHDTVTTIRERRDKLWNSQPTEAPDER